MASLLGAKLSVFNDEEGRILSALKKHGLSVQAAESVETIGIELQVRSLADGLEHAAMVDADSGDLVGTILDGQEDQIDLGALLHELPPVTRCVQIHTHPGSSSFSPEDALILVTHVAIQCMAVVGLDGAWYLLSKAANDPSPPREQVWLAFSIEADALRPKYRAMALSGLLTPEARRRQETHQIWQRVAPLLALRYDQIEPKG